MYFFDLSFFTRARVWIFRAALAWSCPNSSPAASASSAMLVLFQKRRTFLQSTANSQPMHSVSGAGCLAMLRALPIPGCQGFCSTVFLTVASPRKTRKPLAQPVSMKRVSFLVQFHRLLMNCRTVQTLLISLNKLLACSTQRARTRAQVMQ